MKMKIGIVYFLIEYVGTVTYQKNKNTVASGVKIISEEPEPSLLSCAQRCSFRKAEFVYDEPQCTCLVYLEEGRMGGSKETQKTFSGTFYKIEDTTKAKKHIEEERAKAKVENEKVVTQKICPKEEGFCVRQDGVDQNNGVYKLDSLNQKSASQQAYCLRRCQARNDASGCEVIWDNSNRGCYVHTKEVSRGNGVGNHRCWVFSKCYISSYSLFTVQPDIMVKDRLVANITKLYKTWNVTFEVYPTDLSVCHTNIMHMTTGLNNAVYGSRVPGVWFCHDKFHICSAVSGNNNHCYNSKSFPTHTWTKVQIKQQKENNEYQYSIILNDENAHQVVNNQPKAFDDVKLYVTDPWYKTQPGEIRNLLIKTEPDYDETVTN